MCQAVEFDGLRMFNLKELIRARLISEEDVPSDDELARAGMDVHEVCFCSVDVEWALDHAGVPFTVDDLGDIHVAVGAARRTPVLEVLKQWWRTRQWRPQLA